jgi:CheY-like chemotaxis protein
MKKSILAIDESKAIRFLLQTVLGKKYQVITASDGCSALYWLSKRNLPDIIISDPRLPDMGDWELISHIKSSGLYGHIPLVVLSALSEAEMAQKCERFNIRAFFQMPFNPVELMKSIDNILLSEQEMHRLAEASRLNTNNLRAV